MNCPVCKKELKNDNAYAQHVKVHSDFIEKQYTLIIDEYVKYGYITSKILDNRSILLGYGFIKKAIEKNPDIVRNKQLEYAKLLSTEFINGKTFIEISNKYTTGVKHVSKYIKSYLGHDEFVRINQLNKNLKIKATFSEKRINKIKIFNVCVICNKIFLPKKQSVKTCCSNCAGKLRFEKIKLNPPNWSEIQKQSYMKGRKVFGGTTKWYEYKDIKVQGTYELRTCKVLDKMLELKQIKSWEYTNDRLKYIGIDNEWHNYLLDFKVINNDNSFYYIETKGYHTENDLLKWQSVKEQGYKIIIWYNDEIKNKENELGI